MGTSVGAGLFRPPQFYAGESPSPHHVDFDKLPPPDPEDPPRPRLADGRVLS